MLRFILALALSVVVAACTTVDDNPVLSSSPNYSPPTYLRALSADGGLWLAWRHSPAKDSANFAGYRVTVTVGQLILPSQDVAKADSSVFVPGLTNGVPYLLTVRSVAIDHTTGRASQPIIWSSARRYMGLRLYGYPADSGVPVSLVLDRTGARIVESGKGMGDVMLSSTAAPELVSASLIDSTVQRATRFSLRPGIEATGLDDLTLADASVDTSLFSASQVALTTSVARPGIVFALRGGSGLSARLFIRRDGAGEPIQTDTGAYPGRRYVLVDVSLQTTDTVIFAGTGPPQERGGTMAR
jgi:hypothetical protein